MVSGDALQPTTRAAMKLPWYDGNVNGETKVWNADGEEVDLYLYSSLIIDAFNPRGGLRTLFDDIARWLRGSNE